MKNRWGIVQIRIFFILFFGTGILTSAQNVYADIIINLLLVNGTETVQEKEFKSHLPKELKAEDILDTAGLDLEYDVNAGAYVVSGNIRLESKESQTIRVRVKDVWLFNEEVIEDIQGQIDASFNRVVDTEYGKVGEIKRESLLQRLDYIRQEQERYADDVEKRIDRYRTYIGEIGEIRRSAVSVKYWKSKPPDPGDADVFQLILEAKNPNPDHAITQERKHYLPKEVKPEHILNYEGFEVRYDAIKQQSYLSKIEELQPSEVKRYEVGIIDIWNIQQVDIENLKDRTRRVFKLIEPTEYKDSAEFLIENIRNELEAIEDSQAEEKDIYEHISAYRTSTARFAKALTDVESMEEILEAIKENLVRSRMDNVLQKIQSLRTFADIARAIFKNKLTIDRTWKIIIGVVIFVGVLTTIHFAIWGKRSRDVKIEARKKEEEEKENEES